MISAIDAVRVKGDSVGGVVTCIWICWWRNLLDCTLMTGSEHNDEFYTDEHGKIRAKTNRSGGIQRQQNTLTRDKRETELIARGRRDPCVVPRVYYLLSVGMSLSEHKA
ncbi:chorismate synthase 1, chloroplastic [Olea europaea subsp. europaea]|uniref:chorismate synthase n=1 Tax=Olea europaea subsp. europaea TaxID=158383 RepID=A0A8S0V427_OLEEU|nr:chorismate synthase 1, chloroplastic [Olea europaea subsp. europaea]